MLGLPSLWRPAPEEQAISIEIMPITKATNVKQKKINKDARTAETRKDVKKAADPDHDKNEAKKDVAKKDAKIDKEVKKEQKPQVEQEKKKDTGEKIKKDDKKKKEKVEAEKQKKEKQEATKKKDDKKKKDKKEQKKKKDEDFDSLLKSLEDSTTTKKHDKKISKEVTDEMDDLLNDLNDKSDSNEFDDSKPLGMDVKDSIRSQIEKNWNIPAGGKDIEKMRVILQISIKPDGTVTDVIASNSAAYNAGGPVLQAMYESAIRAVYKASPLEGLPQDNYNAWRELELSFDPNHVLR